MKTFLNIKRIFLFVILIISSTISRCQIYKYIGLEDGLNNQKIYHIQKDRRGYMWFLTQEGVDRYDGKQIKHYNFSDDNMKLDSRIALNWFYMDNEDILWVIGQKGRIFKYDSQHDKFELVYIHPELIRNKSQAFLNYGYLDKNDTEAYDGVGLFDFIENELKSLVAEGSDASLPDTNEYGRASKPTAWALLARLYLNSAVYRGSVDTKYYTECITACNKVISNPSFHLEPDYAKLFNADNHKRTHEILFAMVCDATTSVTWGGGTYLVCGSCGNSSSQDPAKYGLTNGWGMFRARGEIVEKFGDVSNTLDSRAMFYTDGQEQYFSGPIDNQSEGYFFEKFSNLTDDGVAASNSAATGCSTDYPLIRLADVYLMAAEALLRGGSGISRGEALNLVNQVRLRAYNNDESGKISDADLTLDFILDERGRELYLESIRRTDLVRFGKFTSDSYIWQWKGGVLDGRSVNERYNIYPIPDTDLTANPNLSNPLY